MCKAVTVENEGFFDESKDCSTKLFQAENIISKLVNDLTIFSIHFANYLMNKNKVSWKMTFSERFQTFEHVVYIHIYKYATQ